jgi:hypothetical protein
MYGEFQTGPAAREGVVQKFPKYGICRHQKCLLDAKKIFENFLKIFEKRSKNGIFGGHFDATLPELLTFFFMVAP